MRAIFFSLTITVFGIYFSYGQTPLNFTNSDASYRQGIEWINESKYLAAQQAFDHYLQTGEDPMKLADAKYYQAYCAIQLKNSDGEMMIERFITENPNHSKASLAYYELANLKYSEKNYPLAIKYFEKCYFPGLNKEMQYEAKFKLGYSYFTQKKFDQAYEMFDQLKREDNKYQFPSSYYAGYLNFQNAEYDRAFYDFTRAEKNSAYAPVIPSMLVKVYYKQKRYDELIEYGSAALERREVRDKPEINLYIGEAYFEKDDFDQASEYYNVYLSGKKGNIDRDLLFRIGYVQMFSGEHAAAIESMKKVALKNDTLGYTASYYLGNLYIKTDNKNYAVSAFKISKDNSYDRVLEEESGFQYAKLNLDLGNFEEAIKAIQEYKSRYPGSERVANIDEILTEAYLNSKNYDLAIEHIEGMQYRSERINKAYQQITFFKGTELFNDAKFRQAVEMFDKSLQHPYSQNFLIKANYWKGEAYSIGLKYEEAVNAYAAVFRADSRGTSEEYLPSRYGIGYAYFNLKQYERALDHFKYYTDRTTNKDNKKHRDALVRLGDCYYATKQYQESIAVFDRAIGFDPAEADYSYFRKGVVYGVMGNMEAANNSFDKVIRDFPESRHMANTLYQKAQFNFENGSYTFAINVFNKLINNYPESNYIPFALQSRAIASSNLKSFDNAERDYKMILEKYPTHEIANSALLGLQEVLQKTGHSDDFDRYLAMYRNANPESDQLESIEFEAVKSLYFNQNYNKAITAIDQFLMNYPSSAMKTEAIYLKADSYYRTDQPLQAIDNYQLIVQDLGFNRHSRVVQRIAEIELASENYEASIPHFEQLEKIASSKKEQVTAWEGLMVAYYRTGDYEKAIDYGRQILDKGQVTLNAKNEALLLIAKSYLALGEKSSAREYLEQTVESAKDENGAEALFLIAELLYENGLNQESIDKLFELNSNFSMYEYWLGRSFILIGDNYLAMEEDFQAKATYQSVVDNSPMEEIVDEAQLKLMVLEEKAEKMAETELDTLEVEEFENR
jgi:tetratricopeptide (TPR) repeat protein